MTRDRVHNHSEVVLVGDYGWVAQWDPNPWISKEFEEQSQWHGKPEHYSIVFLDGHVKYQRLHKGYYVRSEYSILPFKDKELRDLAHQVQEMGIGGGPGGVLLVKRRVLRGKLLQQGHEDILLLAEVIRQVARADLQQAGQLPDAYLGVPLFVE